MNMSALMCLNAGSTSLKFALYRLEPKPDLTLLCKGQVEGLQQDSPRFEAFDATGKALEDNLLLPPHLDASQVLMPVLAWLQAQFPALPLKGVVHRLVQGGDRFNKPAFLNEEALNYLESLSALEPSHQPINVSVARTLMKTDPSIPQIGCFDTAFHRHMPEVAQRYAVAPAVHQAGLVHWGFHGISYEYLSHEVKQRWPQARRVIAMHLGGGASVCAMLEGQSQDTSMGFGAITGLPMSTRCGDVPVDGVLYLLRHKHFSLPELEDLLFKQSGLLGLSQISGDMRTLEAQRDTHESAQLAIDFFVYALSKYVGASAAVLGGVDALVFSGGMGEKSALVRAALCRRLAWMGISLDEAANQTHAACISTPSSAIQVLVIPTNEEWMMAQDARDLLDAVK